MKTNQINYLKIPKDHLILQCQSHLKVHLGEHELSLNTVHQFTIAPLKKTS